MRRKLGNKGVTMMEAVIALVIIALFLVPMLGGFAYSLRADRMALTRTLATYHAQLILESVYGESKEVIEGLISSTFCEVTCIRCIGLDGYSHKLETFDAGHTGLLGVKVTVRSEFPRLTEITADIIIPVQ